MHTLIKECNMPDINEVTKGKLKLVPHFLLCHLVGVVQNSFLSIGFNLIQ